MWFTKQIALGLCLALLMVSGGGCRPRPLPSPVEGVTLQPGRYLEGYYFAPGFAPGQATYALEPFTVEEARGIDANTVADLLQTELAKAWSANGLKLKPGKGFCRVSGVVRQVKVQGSLFRFVMGKLSILLEVSGAITRDGETLFAFSDLIQATSPLKPGPAAPKEKELLVGQAVRSFLNHLLTELLLQSTPGPEVEG